jgi:hypothetical protein
MIQAGMGAVYEAEGIRLDRIVSLKLSPEDVTKAASL